MINFWDKIKDRIHGKVRKGQKRSDDWTEIRNGFISQNPNCMVCGSKKKVEAHHIIPFQIAPDLELDPDNLMTLCRNKKYGINCHLLVGHLGNFRRTNPNVELDAMIWRVKLKGTSNA